MRERLASTMVRNVPFALLERLSETVRRHGGTFVLRPSGDGSPGVVDASCRFPTGDDKLAFKKEWQAV